MAQTTFQKNAIAFVAAHRNGFAIPSADGAVFIFSYGTLNGRLVVIRDRAENNSEVRAILGY